MSDVHRSTVSPSEGKHVRKLATVLKRRERVGERKDRESTSTRDLPVYGEVGLPGRKGEEEDVVARANK